MMTSDTTSTRPYLIRALYEWCTDNGLTPHLAVQVDESVQVPVEFVKQGEIVLNISFDATSGLKLGDEVIEFKGRFGGVPRDVFVPVHKVMGIFARENGQGMSFPIVKLDHQEPSTAPLKSAAVFSGSLVASDKRRSNLSGVQSSLEQVEALKLGSKDTSKPRGSPPSLKSVK